MASEILHRKLRAYSERLFRDFGRSNKLPATIIGAEYNELKEVDRSGNLPVPLAQKLVTELVKIAPLGTKGLDNYVGCCCEVRASNKLILARNNIPIGRIIFTNAIRPRTGQKVNRCQNCKLVFG